MDDAVAQVLVFTTRGVSHCLFYSRASDIPSKRRDGNQLQLINNDSHLRKDCRKGLRQESKLVHEQPACACGRRYSHA